SIWISNLWKPRKKSTGLTRFTLIHDRRLLSVFSAASHVCHRAYIVKYRFSTCRVATCFGGQAASITTFHHHSNRRHTRTILVLPFRGLPESKFQYGRVSKIGHPVKGCGISR